MQFQTYHHIPLSNFDLYAIGAALVAVMAVLSARRIWRLFNDPR